MSSRLDQVCDLMKKMQDVQNARDLIEVLDSLSKAGADAVALGIAAPIVDYFCAGTCFVSGSQYPYCQGC